MEIPPPVMVIGQLVKIWGNKNEWMADNSYVQGQDCQDCAVSG
jgi:hypothetical protein